MKVFAFQQLRSEDRGGRLKKKQLPDLGADREEGTAGH